MNNDTTTTNGPVRRTDQELVRQMLHGQESAYREFVDLYKDRLFCSMVSQVGCRHEAEEIVQESFIKVFLNLRSFQHESRLYTWVYRIAWNLAVTRARKRREDVSLESSGIVSVASAPESFEPNIPIERHERVAMLRRALGEIEKRHRRILVMREFDARSYKEIANIMKIPLGTVRSRLSRARERLKEVLVSIEDRPGAEVLSNVKAEGNDLVASG